MSEDRPVAARDASADSDPAASCPQEFYQALRRQGGSCQILDGQAALLGRRDVDKALRTPATFSSNMGAVHLGNVRPLVPLQLDPPLHSRYRRLINPLFAPAMTARLEPELTALVLESVDALAAHGACDFSQDVALPLPAAALVRILGLPRSDTEELVAMKDGILRPAGASRQDRHAVRDRAGRQCYPHFERALDERRRAPRADLLTHFLEAEIDGERLTTDEILDICYLLLIAGMDTISNALECAFAFLATHPEHRRQIVENPDLIPGAIEELLRWESPTMAVARYVVEDVDIDGHRLSAGQPVTLVLAAANTDDDVIPRGDVVDFARSPNNHLAFGAGIHRCLGLHLARMEMRIVLREWHRRIPEYSLAPSTEIEYRRSGLLRDIEHLPLVWTTAPSPGL